MPISTFREEQQRKRLQALRDLLALQRRIAFPSDNRFEDDYKEWRRWDPDLNFRVQWTKSMLWEVAGRDKEKLEKSWIFTSWKQMSDAVDILVDVCYLEKIEDPSKRTCFMLTPPAVWVKTVNGEKTSMISIANHLLEIRLQSQKLGKPSPEYGAAKGDRDRAIEIMERLDDFQIIEHELWKQRKTLEEKERQLDRDMKAFSDETGVAAYRSSDAIHEEIYEFEKGIAVISPDGKLIMPQLKK
jgi:hypothetical protein